MKSNNMTMFYVSALIAIIGAVGYQYFVKLVPPTINPAIIPNTMLMAKIHRNATAMFSDGFEKVGLKRFQKNKATSTRALQSVAPVKANFIRSSGSLRRKSQSRLYCYRR